MIKTKRIFSVSTKLPEKKLNDIYINVLTWHDKFHVNGSKFHVFSPYFLKTDGFEEQNNNGNILFENFWQGSKVWPIYYDCQIWAHQNLKGIRKHLWFEYKCENSAGHEFHLKDNIIQPKYFEWREKIFSCRHPIRYPNGYKRTVNTSFSLVIDKLGNEKRLDYISARKEIYVKEYCRLVKKLPEFYELLELLYIKKKNLIICEIDVPDNEIITLDKLDEMVNNPNIRFGHGLCLAWELLKAKAL